MCFSNVAGWVGRGGHPPRSAHGLSVGYIWEAFLAGVEERWNLPSALTCILSEVVAEKH